MLSNIRQDIDSIIPKAIYHAIIESNLCYSSLVWVKSFIHLKKERFNKKLQLVRFTDSLIAELGSCLIGLSPSSIFDTSANQRIFFLNNLFK